MTRSRRGARRPFLGRCSAARRRVVGLGRRVLAETWEASGGLFAAGEAAVFAAVGEVDDEAEGHPDDETDPCVAGERDHHGDADESAEDGDDGDPWAAEDARGVWFLDAEDDDGDADEDEGEECADGAHFAPEFTWQDGDGEGCDAADEGVAFPWCLAARVEIREEAREETVAGHAEKDAALSHEEDHDD